MMGCSGPWSLDSCSEAWQVRAAMTGRDDAVMRRGVAGYSRAKARLNRHEQMTTPRPRPAQFGAADARDAVGPRLRSWFRSWNGKARWKAKVPKLARTGGRTQPTNNVCPPKSCGQLLGERWRARSVWTGRGGDVQGRVSSLFRCSVTLAWRWTAGRLTQREPQKLGSLCDDVDDAVLRSPVQATTFSYGCRARPRPCRISRSTGACSPLLCAPRDQRRSRGKPGGQNLRCNRK